MNFLPARRVAPALAALWFGISPVSCSETVPPGGGPSSAGGGISTGTIGEATGTPTGAVTGTGAPTGASMPAGSAGGTMAGTPTGSVVPSTAGQGSDPMQTVDVSDLPPGVTITPPGAAFEGQLSVELAAVTAGAEIRYTTDGTAPTASSPLYDGAPLSVTQTTQLRVQAFVGGVLDGSGAGGVFVARTFDVTSDLPLIVVDGYGTGKPDQKMNGSWVTEEAAILVFEPAAGAATLSQPPTLSSRAGYHVRGQSSSSFEKAPYKVELWDEVDDDRKLPVLGMAEQSDWALVGPFYDRTMIRHAFVYDLGRELGLAAPHFAFAEVYLNYDGGPLEQADYQGIYMVVETIKNAKGRLDLEQLDEDDTTEPDISGGYIFKFDWAAAGEPLITCTGASAPQHTLGQCPVPEPDLFPASTAVCEGEPTTPTGPGPGGGGGMRPAPVPPLGGGESATCWADLEVVDPVPLNAQQNTWLTAYVTALNDALHATPIGPYGDYIDVASFVDTFLLNELTRNGDAYVRSVFFHKDRDQKIVSGPLWDFNLTMAVGGAIFCNQNPVGWAYEFRSGSNDWFQRLIADPAFKAQVVARWKELRQGTLSQSTLEARVAALSGPLAAGIAREWERWPLCSLTGQTFAIPEGDTWEAQLQVMRDFLRERGAWMDTQLQ